MSFKVFLLDKPSICLQQVFVTEYKIGGFHSDQMNFGPTLDLMAYTHTWEIKDNIMYFYPCET